MQDMDSKDLLAGGALCCQQDWHTVRFLRVVEAYYCIRELGGWSEGFACTMDHGRIGFPPAADCQRLKLLILLVYWVMKAGSWTVCP